MFGPIPPPYGGMSVYIQNILESKLVKKVNLKIINTHVPVFYFKYRFFRIVLFLYFFFNFIKMLLSFPIQIVHIHTSANIGFWEKGIFAFISSVFNKKVVLHIHGSEFKEFCEQSKFKNLIIFILKRCDQVVVLSNIWQRYFQQSLFQNNLTVVENGINLNPFVKGVKNSKSINILFIGLLGKRKGVYSILKCISKYRELQSPKIQFYLMGKGLSPKDDIEVLRSLNKYDLSNVNLLGELSGFNKYEYLKNSHIFLLPSYAEGFPIAIIEAMASYLPVISTNVGGIPDMIGPENGILVSPGDIEGLRRAIMTLVSNPKLRRTMGNNNRKKVEEYYNIEIMIDKIYNLYKSLISFNGHDEFD